MILQLFEINTKSNISSIDSYEFKKTSLFQWVGIQTHLTAFQYLKYFLTFLTIMLSLTNEIVNFN